MIGLVWRRRDFRESSRLVSFVTRDRGLVTTLAKGAYRPTSPLLGRIDWLDQVEIRIGRGDLPILQSVRLLHEPRRLREPLRYTCAAHLADALDPAWVEGRTDPELYDLTQGALTLIERGPVSALAESVLGLEFRYLEHLGLAPDLDRCTECGSQFEPGSRPHPESSQPRGLVCARHLADGAARIPPMAAAARTWLADLVSRPARTWIERPGTPTDPVERRTLLADAARVVGLWLDSALERRCRMRGLAFKRLLAA